ncbi:hypothetical protein D3C86_2234820 [compost metagenome]
MRAKLFEQRQIILTDIDSESEPALWQSRKLFSSISHHPLNASFIKTGSQGCKCFTLPLRSE